MARNSEFYKGTRKRRNYAVIPLLILVSLAAVMMVLFGTLQKYAVISKDGVKVELPFLRDENTTIDESGNIVHVFDTVDASIIFDQPDYSIIEQQSKGKVDMLKAIFVSYDELNRAKITEYAERLSSGNALVLEMKPRSGSLAWNSSSRMAMGYGTYAMAAGTEELPAIVKDLKEKNVYLVAQISCLADTVLPSRNNSVALHNEYGGNYSDPIGTWLDPYNTDVRDYVVTMVKELYEMGFDEVVLADVRHPDMTDTEINLTYTAEMSTTPGAVNGVCSFALSVAQQLSDRKGALSIYVDSPPSLVRADPTTGQNAPLFFKLYDRIFYVTDKAAYPYNIGDVQSSITVGKDVCRFVPVVENYLPENASSVSWVFIDTDPND